MEILSQINWGIVLLVVFVIYLVFMVFYMLRVAKKVRRAHKLMGKIESSANTINRQLEELMKKNP
ncbi:MAG: hypothetical protein QME05_06375 [Candidatus Margulisbacteria bacterium]|nr:hypothetical protein [Candidatus Margulisiibacteriota bacterium]